MVRVTDDLINMAYRHTGNRGNVLAHAAADEILDTTRCSESGWLWMGIRVEAGMAHAQETVLYFFDPDDEPEYESAPGGA